MMSSRLAPVVATFALVALSACTMSPREVRPSPVAGAPAPARPAGLVEGVTWQPRGVQELEDLSVENRASRGVVAPTIIDTRTFPQQIQRPVKRAGEPLEPDEIVPAPETAPPPIEEAHGAPDRYAEIGRSDGGVNVALRRSWSAIGHTGWNPPDPTLAVGPNHVVVTVNSHVAFFDKDGNLQFLSPLGSQGSPGFFEVVGARSFVFDPRCMYDQASGRFVVMAAEVYGTDTSTPSDDEATLSIAVSDDSNPNGVWYKYRTNAVLNIGGNTFWWDYPGLGYDDNAIYVTGNLFPLDPNVSAFGGAGFRVFDKAPILAGLPTTFSTLRSGSLSSVQVAQHVSSSATPYFVSTQSSASINITTITDPLTAPSISTIATSIPSYGGAGNAQSPGGSVSTVGSRLMNVQWINGRLVTGHAVYDPLVGQQQARWYEFDTNGWPDSGTPPTLFQSGQITDGPSDDTFFPAICEGPNGNIGIVAASSSSTENVSMVLSGRRPVDSPGATGSPLRVFQGQFGSSGRWGDYYDMALDPTDGSVFWAIGMTQESGGWRTEVAEFSITDAIDVLSPDGGESLDVGEPTSVSWSGNGAGVFQVQQTANAGALATDTEGFESASLPADYTTSGDANWFTQSAVVFDGTFAAQSGGGLGWLEKSTLTTMIEGPSTLSFRYRTSSSTPDKLRFRVNGSLIFAAEGETPWTEYSLELGPGTQEVSWSYERDIGDPAGANAAWIDSVATTSDAEVWTDIVAQTPAGASSVSWTPGVVTDTASVRVRERLSGGAFTPWVRSDGVFAVVAPCPGDIDGDGDADVLDFGILAAHFGAAGLNPFTGGDLDGDGDVDVFDFATFAAGFGCGTGP